MTLLLVILLASVIWLLFTNITAIREIVRMVVSILFMVALIVGAAWHFFAR